MSESGTDSPCSHFETVCRTTFTLTASSCWESPLAFRMALMFSLSILEEPPFSFVAPIVAGMARCHKQRVVTSWQNRPFCGVLRPVSLGCVSPQGSFQLSVKNFYREFLIFPDKYWAGCYNTDTALWDLFGTNRGACPKKGQFLPRGEIWHKAPPLSRDKRPRRRYNGNVHTITKQTGGTYCDPSQHFPGRAPKGAANLCGWPFQPRGPAAPGAVRGKQAGGKKEEDKSPAVFGPV